MTNEERRQALALARRKAMDYAIEADGYALDPGRNQMNLATVIRMADMWAHIAQSMKVGNAIETDGADGNQSGDVLTRGSDEYFAAHIR